MMRDSLGKSKKNCASRSSVANARRLCQTKSILLALEAYSTFGERFFNLG